MTDPRVGQVLDVVLLDKQGGKRTGQTRPVKVLQLEYLFGFPGRVRRARVETVDGKEPYRVEWVEPRYLKAQGGG